MADIEAIVDEMHRNPKGVDFADLEKLCRYYFGKPRPKGSHLIFRTPMQGQRINIQRDKRDKKRAKAYQVKQVLGLIDQIEQERK